jgi:hypothetical protein
MIFKKLKYGPSLKKILIDEILLPLGLTRTSNHKSFEIYETFRDYMDLEQCSRNEAITFTAKFHGLSERKMSQILADFIQD